MGFPAPLSRDRKLRAEAPVGGILGVEPEPCPAGEWGSGGCRQAYESWRSRYRAPQEEREATQMSRAVEEPVSAEWVGPVPRVAGWP